MAHKSGYPKRGRTIPKKNTYPKVVTKPSPANRSLNKPAKVSPSKY